MPKVGRICPDSKSKSNQKCLLLKPTVRKGMTQLRSLGHQIMYIKLGHMNNCVNDTALSCFDDKRYHLRDTVSSLALGQYSLAVSRQESRESETPKVNVNHI